MVLRRKSLVMAVLLMVFMVTLGKAVSAVEKVRTDSGVTLPVIPRGQGDSCVADTRFMRRNHMNVLMHQRDETVLNGIRSKRFSLKECVTCHAVTGPDAKPVSITNPKHFCRSCHDYAAVEIDCFQCHASRPEPSMVALE